MDVQENQFEEDGGDGGSLESNQLSTKQYFLVNLSKFVVEMLGTAVLGTFYLLMGDS